MMKLILIKRSLTNKEIENIKFRLLDDSQVHIASSIPNLPFNNIKNFSSLNTDKKKEINYYALQTILNFGNKINNKAFISFNHLNFNNIWIYNKFRIYFLLCNYLYEKNEIDDLLSRYQHITLYSNNSLLDSIQDKLQIIKNIKSKPSLNFSNLFKYFFFIKIRILKNCFKFKQLKKSNFIIFDLSQKQNCIDINTFNQVKGNYNLHYLINQLPNDFITASELSIPKFYSKNKFNPGFSNLFNKSKKVFFSETVLFSACFSLKITTQLNNLSKELKHSYSELNSTEINKTEIFILNQLKSFHKSSLYYCFRFLAWNRFFVSHKNIKAIATTDENSPLLKSILDAAKANNIKTFGIQHGNIHDLHPAYMFTQKDKENKMMPDYTLVWGEYYKSFLSSIANYPSDSLIITGQIRTDIIPRLKEINHKILPDNIPVEKKIILFASQPQRDAALRKQAAYDVFKAASLFPDAFLVVKLHPGELNDFEYYNDIAKEAGCNNYKIIYYFDLYLLIAASDIIITCFSTVGSETVYFYKPLIVLDHLKQDIQNYCKAGVGIQADSADSLIVILKSFFNGSLKINKTAYDNFISMYAYKIDGQATQRCLNAIRNNS